MPENLELSPDPVRPSVTFESITFSDGTTIRLDPADIVVLVGPNNAGKSAALREVGSAFNEHPSLTVLQSYRRRIVGEPIDFLRFVTKHAYIRRVGDLISYSGYLWDFSVRDPDVLQEWWPDRIHVVRTLFCLNMTTENRLRGSNPPDAINLVEGQLSHPIHMLVEDDALELKLSSYFRKAFNADMILERVGGNIPLLVGNRPAVQPSEDRLSKSYRERLRASTSPLTEQGDGMRSFASVILHLLAPTTASVLLLDEPEAFLHPPQARFLGEIIATEKPSGAQLFVATHSPDVLQGLVNVASDHLRLLRIQRDGNVNRVKELDKKIVKKIGNDPLMNYSSVMSGVFHERVIICEADSDCMFYSSILDLGDVHGEGQPDVLFVHANGKDRMATLAETLTALDVQVDVIADLDIVRHEGTMKAIVDALGSDWTTIQPVAQRVRTSVAGSKPALSLDQIKAHIREMLDKELPSSNPERELRSVIDKVFRSASPWDAVKQSGASAIPKGQATRQFQDLQELCESTGLWIVPVGEMEGFCRSIGRKGPDWVQRVIEERQLATDPDLEGAREFVRALWNSRC